uniref:Uncharacterized protein n=1 Tax=Salix viminalis TaxID=40686 RepID=A0A6N2MVK6_SALVM
MDTSKPAIFVNGALLPMHVRKRVRTVIQVVGADRGAIVGKSPDDLQLVVKGSPPSAPLSNFVEVIGIADSEKSIQAEIWTNFGEIHIPTTSCVSLQMGNISTYSSEVWWPCFVLKLEVLFGPDVARRKIEVDCRAHILLSTSKKVSPYFLCLRQLKEFSLQHGFDRPTFVILEHFLVAASPWWDARKKIMHL